MSFIIIRTSYDNAQAYGDRTGQVFGTQYDTYNWVFDTVTQTVSRQFAGTYDDFQDSTHPEEFNYAGEFYAYCAGTTRRGFTGDEQGGFTVAEEENSLSCGYTPPAPLTCDLGVAKVDVVANSPTGATLKASFTGTVNGRMQYRLDTGAEQSQPDFYTVAPGEHRLKFRDDGLAGCEQTVTFVVDPPPLPAAPLGPAEGIDFVQQPLWYDLPNAPKGAEALLELYAESAHGAEDFALVLMLRKRADQLGKLRFRLDTLLYPLLSAFVPPVAGPLRTQRCTTNLLNYYVRTTLSVPGRAPVVSTKPVRTALRGGLPAEWQDVNYFRLRELRFSLPPCLSWQPAGPGTYAAEAPKAVTRPQPEWLFWLSTVDAPGLRVARSYDNGPGTAGQVTYEQLPDPPTRGWLRQLLAIPMRAVGDYQRLMVQVETAAGEPLSQPAWYSFVEETPRTRYLLFTNSLGTTDTLRCEGRLDVTLEATTEKVERPVQLGDAVPAADVQVSDLSASRKLKLATGWLEPEELAWLQELVLSREVWLAQAQQLRPLDWSKRTLATYSDEPGLRGLLLEFDYAYAPTAYAPGIY
ncbi:MAG: hypothetical protein ACRYF0_17460 [Janthinobacterium lividum]